MNCCNEFGTCENGLGCLCGDLSVQVQRIIREQRCPELGGHNCATVDECNSSPGPVSASAIPAESGNIWFAEPEPPDPLTRAEMLAVWSLVLAVSVIGWVLIAMGSGYVWTRWLA